MEISFAEQLLVALNSVLLGLGLGAFYDLIRIVRVLLGVSYVNKFNLRLKNIRLPLIKNPLNSDRKKKKIAEGIMIFITDIVYFFVATLVMTIYTYHINFGIVRWYIFAGAIVGVLFYYVTLGKLVISISECIAFFTKVAFLYLVYFISRPFSFLYVKIKPCFLKIKLLKIKHKKSENKILKCRAELYKIGK